MPYADKEAGKAHKREYYQKNKERFSKNHREYYLANKEKILVRDHAYRKANPDIIKANKNKYLANNREAISARRRLDYSKNRQKYLDIAKSYRIANLDRVKANRRKVVYGLTQEQFDHMYESQGGRCAIDSCRRPLRKESRGNDRPCIDHNGTTGAVREILCSPCNLAIGHAYHNPEILDEMAAYIRKHSQKGLEEKCDILTQEPLEMIAIQNTTSMAS